MQDSAEHNQNPEHLWEAGWEGHRRAQRERMAKLTLEQKLEWLEEAHRLVQQLAKDRDKRSD